MDNRLDYSGDFFYNSKVYLLCRMPSLDQCKSYASPFFFYLAWQFILEFNCIGVYLFMRYSITHTHNSIMWLLTLRIMQVKQSCYYPILNNSSKYSFYLPYTKILSKCLSPFSYPIQIFFSSQIQLVLYPFVHFLHLLHVPLIYLV